MYSELYYTDHKFHTERVCYNKSKVSHFTLLYHTVASTIVSIYTTILKYWTPLYYYWIVNYKKLEVNSNII